MIDEACNISTNVRVNHPASVKSKAPDFPTAKIAILPILTRFGSNLLSLIGNNPFIFIDVLKSKNSPTMKLGSFPLDLG
tara:strand:- start:244 stop:480 length:237 start_codon:yes stop_codon:yes gene_type:complete